MAGVMGAHMLVQVWKVAPALAAGNAVILKPSEYASVTSLELGAIAGDLMTAGPLSGCSRTVST